jgi:signal transduction histidine kinase
VGRLMELLLENAGAQRGALVLRNGETLALVARLAVANAQIETGLAEPLGQSHEVATTVIQYVARTGEAVVVADATTEARFAEDPYLAAHAVRSLLALPLTHRGHLVGVLYLEHRDVPSAFPPARIALLAVLASQAAIAVENAFLYRDLETKVAQRTAEYKSAKDSADKANQAKSDFLASMSHELRTPLNGILGYAQILARMPEMPPRGQEGVRVIQRSGEHLLTLINDVLDLAKIEAGKMELAPQDIHFSFFLQTVVSLARVRADQKGLAFHQEQSGPALGMVHVDEKRLLQVLLNLLGNAVKFTERGAVTLRVNVHEGRGAEDEPQVCFQVLDTGPGIAPEHLARIFGSSDGSVGRTGTETGGHRWSGRRPRAPSKQRRLPTCSLRARSRARRPRLGGSGRLRALSCPSLCASVMRGRGRWGGGCHRRGLAARVESAKRN